MDSPYIYERLPRSGQIRLLRLQPGTGDSDIHSTLVTANLHEDPEYEVISYCWGGASNLKTLYCDGRTIQVTDSLYTGLRRLRKPDQVRTLWADAVCINQKDNVEKGQQVNLMSHIYSQPQNVLIWLGDDMTGLDGLEESIRGALDLLPPETEDHDVLIKEGQRMFREAAKLRREKKPNFNDHNWIPINYLLSRPWFDRRWIIQEVAMAPDNISRIVICGNIEFPWADLASICYRIGSYGLVASISGLSIINRYSPSMASFFLENGRPLKTLAMTYFVMLIKKYRLTANLVDAVTATSLFQCTEPKDHLYSLLNITPFNSDLTADYNTTHEDTCMRFAVAILLKDRNLRLLSLAPHTHIEPGPDSESLPPGKRLDLPTWVPDLTHQGAINPMVSYTIRKQLFHAGGLDQEGSSNNNDNIAIAISADHRLLRLRGRIVDRIAAVTRCNIDVPFPHPEMALSARVKARMRDWLVECRDLAAAAVTASSPTIPHDDDDDAFAHTLLCGMTAMRDPIPAAVLPHVHTYMSYVLESQEEGFVLTEELRQTMLTYGPLVEQSLATMCEARRFCRTQGGRLGQVRKEAREGDQVVVVLGAEVPYVIRPRHKGKGKMGEGGKEEEEEGEGEGVYELVGDCYLHGVMQGEALSDARYETVDIVLA